MMINHQIQTVGIYCRLSKDDNTGVESNSITNQKLYLTDYVKQRGWAIYKIYIDEGKSGTNFDRDGFKELISDIETKRIDCVVVKDLSRLGRNYLDSGYYIEKYFPEHRIRFIAVNDSLDSNDGENDFGPFKNIINEWYAKDISKKIKFSFSVKAKQGTLLQGFAPYGYLKCEDRVDYEIDEEVADIIRYIFNSIYNNIPAKDVINYLKKNKVYVPGYHNYLKKGINKEKYESYTEEKKYAWDYWKLDMILTNEIYIGTLVNFKRKKLSFRSKKLVENDPEKMVKVYDRFPPIISKEVFDKVSEIRHLKYRAPRNDQNIFSRFLFCADCGKKMTLRKQGYKNRSHILYYHCSHCNGHYIRLDLLKQQVINDFKELKEFISSVPQDEIVNEINKINKKKAERKNKVDTKEYTSSVERKVQLDNLISKLLDSYTKGIIPDDVYESMMLNYKKEYDEISSKIKKLEGALATNDTEIQKVSIKELEYILSINEEEILQSDFLNAMIKKIQIQDSQDGEKTIRNTHIEYYSIGELKELYEENSSIIEI
ncbi:MAG: recombinase family protein [Anaeroplasmataceae bacterium]|nr:recombinase family protein [Anaeroplasmataceae bacterium]